MKKVKFHLDGLKNLCTIIGKGSGVLYKYNDKINKSGMVAVAKLVHGKPKTEFVLVGNIIPLKKLGFYRLLGHGDPLNVADVFNNIHKNLEVICHEDTTDVSQVMPLMVPNFDEDQFKPHHAVMVFNWYEQLVNLEKLKAEEEELKNKLKNENE